MRERSPGFMSYSAAIDTQSLTRDPAGLAAGEKQYRSADVGRLPQAAQGNIFHQMLLTFSPQRLPLPFGGRVGKNKTRRHAVDGNSEGAQFMGELPDQADLPRFGAGIGLDPGQTDTQAGAA